MRVIIPVAGVGSRLRPHTHSTPKVLLPVAGKPIIDHVLQPVAALNPDEVLFVVGYMGDAIQAYVEKQYQFKSTFVWQEQLLGLGHAVNLAIQKMDNGPLLVVLGDTIVDADLRNFVDAGEYVLGLRQVEDPQRFGIAELRDGRIVRLEEKPAHPKTNLAVIGLYYFQDSKKVREALKAHTESGKTTKGEIQFTDALERMIHDGVSFIPYEVNGWYDCGKKETVLETNRHLLAGMDSPTHLDGSAIVPPVFIAPDAKVTASVLGPYVSISEGATVDGSVISNSIIGPGAILRNVNLKDSLVGSNANLSGTTAIVNVGDSAELMFT